ncbi:hypothetical protein NE865_02155 [Phthorimaea operculella]|nr:hypothetical protein NE865_02155 [Phthorimaea operculella]
MRFALLLAVLCTVQAMSRVKRATTGGNRTAATVTNNTGTTASTGPASSASSSAPGSIAVPAAARRANDVLLLFHPPSSEENDDPINLHVRKKTKERETSSSSAERDKDESDEDKAANKESLGLSDDSGSGSDSDKKKFRPQSTEERHGWRKWHRKCTPCPEEMKMKWRDPRIKWVCGAYQRARRSFKSLCMMRYRNCQDGTMFVYIHDHRCANSSADDSAPHGEHFMYDYKAKLSDDSSDDKSDTTTSSESDPDSSKMSD